MSKKYSNETILSSFNFNQIIDMGVDEFIELYEKDKAAGLEIIRSNLDYNKNISLITLPFIGQIEWELPLNLHPIFNKIEEDINNQKQFVPLKSFFGEMSKSDYRKSSKFTIVTYNEEINIDQLYFLYNAMAYPITYV